MIFIREEKQKETHPDENERMCFFLYFDYNTMEKNFV